MPRSLWPEHDVFTGKERVGVLLNTLGKEAIRGRAHMMVLAEDGGCEHAECTGVNDAAASLRIRVAGHSPLIKGDACLVVFCLHQYMHVFDGLVLAMHAPAELVLAYPAFVVRGGGRDFFRVRPPTLLTVCLNFTGGCLCGWLGDLGEGGLALWVDAQAAVDAGPGTMLVQVHLSVASLELQAPLARVCSKLEKDSSCRLSIELLRIDKNTVTQLRKLLLAWQGASRLDHGR
ncbi:hypothetical protein EGI20_14845 [Aquitalea sp. S1-19]|nr:hypothetical protein [Aquitalea sp. S1-19]